MTEPRRLFDCIQYHLERKPLDDMLAAKEAGQWKKYSLNDNNSVYDLTPDK